MPDQAKDRQKYAGTVATVIAVGDNAFIEWGEGAVSPAPGDRILFAQYTGAREKGADGDDYLIMNDEDVLCVVTSELVR